jgi:multiple sugar transport system substrate-binding protein
MEVKNMTNVTSGDAPQVSISESGSSELTRRTVLKSAGIGAAGMVGASLLGAATSSQAEAFIGNKAAIGATTVSFVFLGSADQAKSWDALFAGFKTKFPQIDFKANAIPSDNWAAFADAVATQLAGGAKYDVLNLATEGALLFASKGVVRPLDDLIARDKAVMDAAIADTHPRLVAFGKKYGPPDGKTYYLPSGGMNTMCAWVNKDVFKKAGLALPTDDWTWDDFLKAGRTIKKKTGAFMFPVTAEYFVGIMPWLTTNGASTMNTDWTKATCDTPHAIEAASFARQLVVEKLSPPPGGTFDRFALGVADKLAVFGGGRWPVLAVRAAKAVNKYEIFDWPHKGVKRGSPVGWAAFPIMKSTGNVDASWEFVKYLSSFEGASVFAKSGGTAVPCLKSVANSADYLSDSPKGTEKLYRALDYATAIPSPTKGNLTQRAIEDVWGQIIAGNITPSAGMKKMQSQLSKLLV